LTTGIVLVLSHLDFDRETKGRLQLKQKQENLNYRLRIISSATNPGIKEETRYKNRIHGCTRGLMNPVNVQISKPLTRYIDHMHQHFRIIFTPETMSTLISLMEYGAMHAS
jgi:hypothetical protein